MSSRSNMSGSACAKPEVTILARVRGACRDAYLAEFPANWHVARRWTKWGPHRYCIRARDRPGIYLELRMATAAHALTPLAQLSRAVADWVNSVCELTQPRAVHWCEGTEAEARRSEERRVGKECRS